MNTKMISTYVMAAAATTVAHDKPNILFIFADDMSYETVHTNQTSGFYQVRVSL